MSTKVGHNAREQRRARRINDKIVQLKGFLEHQGRGFRPDKYSILDAACVQLQFMYELLVDVGPSLGWADPVEELRRRMKAAPVTANEAGDESDLEETVTAPKRPRTSGTCKAGAAAVATPSDETIKLESPEAPPSSADVTESAGSRDSKRTRASLRPYSTYSVLEPAYFQHLMFNADLPSAIIDAGAFHTFASPMYCDMFNLTSLSGPVGVNLTSLVTHAESERLQTVISDLFSRFSESKLRRGPREAVFVSLAFIINGSETARDVVFSCVPGNGKFPDFVLLEVLPTSNAPPLKVPQPKRVPKAPSVPKLPPAPVEAAVPAAPVPASRSKEHHQVHKAALAHPSPANPVAAMKREAQAARHPPPTPTPSPLPSYMSGGTPQAYPGFMPASGYRHTVDSPMFSPYQAQHSTSSGMQSPASMYPGSTPIAYNPQLFSGMPLEMMPPSSGQMYGGSGFAMPPSMMPPQYYMGYSGGVRHTGMPFADYSMESSGGPSTH